MLEAIKSISLWWEMHEIQNELAENPKTEDSTVVLSFMGSGGSHYVTAGDLRKLKQCEKELGKAEVSLNDRVTFKLSKRGAEIYNEDEARLYAAIPKFPRERKVYEEGQEVSMQLHEAFSLFGEHTGLGMETFCQEASMTVKKT